MAILAQGSISRRDSIVAAIAAELERQSQNSAARIDIEALADTIEAAIVGHGEISEGRHPDELNATNDD